MSPTRAAGAVALLALISCAEAPTREVPSAISLVVVSGDQQSAPMGAELPAPLVVKVLSANGRPVKAQLVNFRVKTGGGNMFAGSAITDAGGQAQDYWTLGNTRGAQQVDVVAVDPTSGAKLTFGSFTAIGQAPASLASAPSGMTFPTVPTGSTTAGQTVTYSNTGDLPTGPMTLSLAGAHPADFALGPDNCTGGNLAPGATCTATVSFTPSAMGSRNATLSGSATPGGTTTVSLAGAGMTTYSVAWTPPSSTSFSAPVGSASGTVQFRLQNTSTTPVTGFTVTLAGSNPGDFVIPPGANQCAGVTLGSGNVCYVWVAFQPTATGSRSALLRASGGNVTEANATLAGTGLQPATLSVTPTSFDFGPVAMGSTGSSQIFQVTNTGSASSGAVGFSGSGATGDFTVNNGCANAQLAPGQSCVIQIAFRPTATGTRSASFAVTASPGGTASFSVSGTGQTPPSALLSLTPGATNFGTVVLGQQSAGQTFILTNSGSGSSGAVSASVAGDPVTFPIVNDSCTGVALAGGATCSLTVVFMPTVAGSATGTLTASASPGGTATSGVSGTGVTPAQLAASQTTVDFGLQPVGVPTRTPVTIGIINTGGQSTGTLTVDIAGAQAGEFASTGCAGTSLMGGASCTLSITFTAGAIGPRGATLTVTSAAGATVSIALAGTGQ